MSRRRTKGARWLGCAAVSTVLGSTPVAFATPTGEGAAEVASAGERPTTDAPADPAVIAAETRFADGKRLFAEGRVAEACLAFEEAHRERALPGILLNLANCHELQGRLVLAASEFREALVLAKRADRADRVAFAEQRLAAIQPRLARLVVRITPRIRALDQLSVVAAGVPVAPDRFGVSLPVDPGAVVVEVRAAGHELHVDRVVLTEGEIGVVIVDDLVAIPRAGQEARRATTAPVAPADGGDGWADTVGWSFLIGGGVVLAAGAITGAVALAEEGAAGRAGCAGQTCPTADGLSHSQTANAAGTAANVLVPSGLLLGVTGTTLVLAFD